MNITFGKMLIFSKKYEKNVTLLQVEKATLRIVVNYRKKTKLAKEGFLGEMFVKCCDVDWTTEQPVTFASPLLKSREKNVSI